MGVGSHRSIWEGEVMWLYLPAKLLAANIFWGRGKHCITGVPIDEPAMFQLVFPNP